MIMRNKYRKHPICIDCNKETSKKSIRCKSCSNKNRPSIIHSEETKKKIAISVKKYSQKVGRRSYNLKENNGRWLGGIHFNPYPLGWNKTFKEQIRYRDGYVCQICGISEVECIRRLDVHHIDYDKINININNLVSLCKSCHGKTNANREYWIEYFGGEYE